LARRMTCRLSAEISRGVPWRILGRELRWDRRFCLMQCPRTNRTHKVSQDGQPYNNGSGNGLHRPKRAGGLR
jgi:hypothetical protein